MAVRRWDLKVIEFLRQLLKNHQVRSVFTLSKNSGDRADKNLQLILTKDNIPAIIYKSYKMINKKVHLGFRCYNGRLVQAMQMCNVAHYTVSIKDSAEGFLQF